MMCERTQSSLYELAKGGVMKQKHTLAGYYLSETALFLHKPDCHENLIVLRQIHRKHLRPSSPVKNLLTPSWEMEAPSWEMEAHDC